MTVKKKSYYNIMHKVFTYYPKSEKFTCIYTTNSILYSLFGKIKINLSVHACTIFNFDGRKFLIYIEAYTKSKNKDECVKLMLGLKHGDNVMYSTLLSALNFFKEKGYKLEDEYIAPDKNARGISDILSIDYDVLMVGVE